MKTYAIREVQATRRARPRLTAALGVAAWAQTEASTKRMRDVIRPSPASTEIPAREMASSTVESGLPRAAHRQFRIGDVVDDPLERKADTIADHVVGVRGTDIAITVAQPALSRKCAACDEDDRLQRTPSGSHAAAGRAPAIVHEVLRCPGQPLDEAARAYFEPRFGEDFGGVRVHTDAGTAERKVALEQVGQIERDWDRVKQIDAGTLASGRGFGASLASVAAPSIQRKPTVSALDDVLEREADNIADQVMRMSAAPVTGRARPVLQSACAACEEKETIHAKRAPSVEPDPTLNVAAAVRATWREGTPLSGALRTYFEPRFGQDFSDVRIHASADAAAAARAIHARAYTFGRDIVFGAGEYAPATADGRRLIAHELVHVVQQAGGRSAGAPAVQRLAPHDNDALHDGDEIGELAVADDRQVQRLAIGHDGPVIQRQPAPTEATMSSQQEIQLSLTSPGLVALRLEPPPPALSFFNYGNDRAEPKELHVALMQELASFLHDAGVSLRITVTGRASSPGTTEHNLELSRRRANLVAQLLRSRGLIRIDVAATGKSQPVASNDTAEGRSRNRAVDITLAPLGTAPRPGPGPGPEPGPTRPDRSLCARFPLLCSLIPILPFPVPPPWPLLCTLVPELCPVLPCLMNPAMCTISPPPPPPPDRRRPQPRGPLFVLFDPVRARNTPIGANDRIPDAGTTSVGVQVSGWQSTMPPIRIAAAGTNTANGDVRINGTTELFITGSTSIQVGGISQTSPRAPQLPLSLMATMGPATIGQSFPFAVAAFMYSMSTTLGALVDTATELGMVASMRWDSDGAAGKDSLDELEFEEQLHLESETGTFAGTGLGSHGGRVLGSIMPQGDNHTTPRQFIRDRGRQVVQQVHAFLDERSQSIGAVDGSGFLIVRVVEADRTRPGCDQFVITKTGRAGTVAGFRSGAGTGSAEATIPLPCPSRGGGGSTPSPDLATSVIPRPFLGPIPPGTVPFSYVGGLSPHPVSGTPAIITIAFRLGGRVFTAPVPVIVDPETPTHVRCHCVSPILINVAPIGATPVVMQPGAPMHIPHAVIR